MVFDWYSVLSALSSVSYYTGFCQLQDGAIFLSLELVLLRMQTFLAGCAYVPLVLYMKLPIPDTKMLCRSLFGVRPTGSFLPIVATFSCRGDMLPTCCRQTQPSSIREIHCWLMFSRIMAIYCVSILGWLERVVWLCNICGCPSIRYLVRLGVTARRGKSPICGNGDFLE